MLSELPSTASKTLNLTWDLEGGAGGEQGKAVNSRKGVSQQERQNIAKAGSGAKGNPTTEFKL